MKFLVLFVGLFAYASSSIAPYGHGLLYGAAYGYHGPQHIPVIGPNGVPLEPHANVAARAQHAAAVIEAKARNGDLYAHGLGYGAHGLALGPLALAGHGAPLGVALAGHGAPLALGLHGYHGAQHIPIIGPNGVPLEPPANVAARVQHAHAVAEAQARNGDLAHGLLGHGIWGRKRRSIYAAYGIPAAAHGIPVIGPHGVPLELPANVAARAAHAAAHANAAGAHGLGLGLGLYGAHLGYGYGHSIAPLPVHGVPQDTHEVAAAKAAHFAAHAEANARLHGLGHGAYLSHNGLPLDTPEVAAAKAAHFAAHAAAAHGGHHGGYY